MTSGGGVIEARRSPGSRCRLASLSVSPLPPAACGCAAWSSATRPATRRPAPLELSGDIPCEELRLRSLRTPSSSNIFSFTGPRRPTSWGPAAATSAPSRRKAGSSSGGGGRPQAGGKAGQATRHQGLPLRGGKARLSARTPRPGRRSKVPIPVRLKDIGGEKGATPAEAGPRCSAPWRRGGPGRHRGDQGPRLPSLRRRTRCSGRAQEFFK